MALTQHQARNYNHADVAAKDGSQETAVNLAALVTGLVLLPAVHGHPTWMWAVFLAVTAGHVYANYRAVKAVVMQTFDEQRIRIVANAIAVSSRKTIPTPAEVAALETLYYTPEPIRLGCSIADADVPPDTLVAALAAADGGRRRPTYVVVPLRAPAAAGSRRRAVGVILAAGATQADVVEACIAGHLAVRFMDVGESVAGAIDSAMRIVGPPHQLAHRLGDAGWRLHTLAYTVGAFRVHIVADATSQPDPVPSHSPKPGSGRTPNQLKQRNRASGTE